MGYSAKMCGFKWFEILNHIIFFYFVIFLCVMLVFFCTRRFELGFLHCWRGIMFWIWRLCIFEDGCYVIRFVCVNNDGCGCWYHYTWHLSNFGLHKLYAYIPHLIFGRGLVQFKEPSNISCVNMILAYLREAYYNNKAITQNN